MKSDADAVSTRCKCASGICSTAGEYVRPGGKPLDADLIGDVQRIAASLDW